MAAEIALAAQEAGHPLLDQALSSRTRAELHPVGETNFRLLGPEDRDTMEIPPETISIEFSQPDAALGNIAWFVERQIPFVCGTTGFDEAKAREMIAGGEISAVMAPNMAIPIILIQAAVKRLADSYPEALSGYGFSLTESHQATKKDTSGTAKALVKDFARLGLPASAEAISKIRDPEKQQNDLQVPEEHLQGHAYHDYEVNSPDGSVVLGLSHRVHGRRIYADGSLVAARFLYRQVTAGSKGHVYTMEDVLRG